MNCCKKIFFILSLNFCAIFQCIADCIDSYGRKSYGETSTLIPDMAVFFNKIDKDSNGYISEEELEYSSNTNRFNYVDLLIIWSLRESYDYIISISNDEYFFERDGLSFNDVKIYISEILHDKDIRVLLYKMKHLSYGIMPSGIDSINYQYIRQQQMGDCGLIAAITSLAYSRPDDIYNMLTQNEDGSFNVSFPLYSNIKVAPSIETLYKGSLTRSNGFWLLILELSFIKLISDEPLTIIRSFSENMSYLKDSFYHAIWKNTKGKLSRRNHEIAYSLRGITAKKAISVLTGNSAGNWQLYMNTADEIRGKLYELSHYKKIAVANLHSSYYKYLCQTRRNLQILSADSCYKNLIPPYRNLPDQHYYSILFYDNENDAVVLRNPWGYGEPSDPETHCPIDGRDDGIFEMKIEAFMEVFDTIEFEE